LTLTRNQRTRRIASFKRNGPQPEHYRGAIIELAPMGHVNVTRVSDGGFVGGFDDRPEARRYIDDMHRRAAMTVTQVGPDSYRVSEEA
jgi:hypothetical protein